MEEVQMYKQYYGMDHNPFEKDLETKHAYVTQYMQAVDIATTAIE